MNLLSIEKGEGREGLMNFHVDQEKVIIAMWEVWLLFTLGLGNEQTDP